jgi:GH15 family glucan-1,4-alpha-glucosidase
MPRDLPIGNGSLLVNYDQNYDIRDIYYPNVGSFQHTLGHHSRIGIWIDGHFSWLNSNEWQKSLKYQDDTLSTHVTAINSSLHISIIINDVVDFRENILLRKFTIKNLASHSRQVRIFLNQDLHLSENPIGDTAYYDPKIKSIIHYKRNLYFLINCLYNGIYGIDEYAVGIQDFKNAEGTWRDAEDGFLSGDCVADGSVDSTIAISLSLPDNKESIVYSWLIAGKSYDEIIATNDLIQNKTPKYFINRTNNYWKAWLKHYTENIETLKIKINKDPIFTDNIYRLYDRSLLVLQTQIDKGGAITAGNDWDTVDMGMDKYSYMWPRDGAMISYALDKAGCKNVTDRFFRFCANIITADGYFMHKYHPDRSLGSTWHPKISNGQVQMPIQEDGTALIIWSFYHHFQKYNDIELLGELYESLIVKAGDFMVNYRDKITGLPLPSYDLWEERYGIHTYTVSAIHAGLKSASALAEVLGDLDNAKKYGIAGEEVKIAMDKYLYDETHKKFVRMIKQENGEYQKDLTTDSSLYGTFAFGVYDVNDPKVALTMKHVIDDLTIKTDVGGVARYKNDYLHRIGQDFDRVPGNSWFICNLWIAQYYIAKARTIYELNEAIPILEWVNKYAFESGILPEQLNPYTGQPLSISPLSWSHSEFIVTIHNYLEKLGQILSK